MSDDCAVKTLDELDAFLKEYLLDYPSIENYLASQNSRTAKMKPVVEGILSYVIAGVISFIAYPLTKNFFDNSSRLGLSNTIGIVSGMIFMFDAYVKRKLRYFSRGYLYENVDCLTANFYNLRCEDDICIRCGEEHFKNLGE